jgi:hypothetical protein
VGATSWDFLVPYQDDAATAMAALRAETSDPYVGFLGHTYAVTEKEAQVTFGTTAPTIDDLERWGGVDAPEMQSLLPAQGTGRHLVLHTDDRPSHILFWGRSGS